MSSPESSISTPRDTRQRSAIRNAFVQPGRLLAVKEVLAIAAEAVPGIGVATVYRNLRSMVEFGDLISVELPGEPPRYALPGQDTSVLFLCKESGRAFAFDQSAAPVVPQLPAGFDVTDSRVILGGIAPREA